MSKPNQQAAVLTYFTSVHSAEVDTVAEALNLSKSSAFIAIKALIDKGLLMLLNPTTPNGKPQKHRYMLNMLKEETAQERILRIFTVIQQLSVTELVKQYKFVRTTAEDALRRLHSQDKLLIARERSTPKDAIYYKLKPAVHTKVITDNPFYPDTYIQPCKPRAASTLHG